MKDGWSDAAIRHFGDDHGSALHVLWHAAILKMRGVPLYPTEAATRSASRVALAIDQA